MANTENKLDEKQMKAILDTLYGKVVDGVPKVSKLVEQFAQEYVDKNSDLESAVKSMANYQIVKCGTSGFLTGLGGLITLPVAIPANVSSVMYVQLRMIAAIAYMGGYDIQSDQVQTLTYACLTGSAMADILKQAGIKFGEKLAIAGIKKIPTAVITKINQKVMFRFITKFGEKGIVNLGKMVPIVGGVIGGVVDVASTRIIANNAYSLFIKGVIPSKDSEEFVDADFTESDDLEE